MFYPSPIFTLPNGAQVWAADAIPSGDTLPMPFQAGDYIWVTSPTAGLPAFYKCITAPSSGTPDGVWQAAAGSSTSVTVSAAYTALVTDDQIIQTNASGVAVTLPAAASVPNKSYTITNSGGSTSNTVVVAGGGLINAGHTITLTSATSSVTVKSNGTQYYVTAAFGTNTVT